MSVKCSYAASVGQLSAWYGSATQLEWDDNQEPTAADHGDVLYEIGKIPDLNLGLFTSVFIDPQVV